jgi:thiamine-phosphate pyrophosphorylase
VRDIWTKSAAPARPIIGVSCHSDSDVARAAAQAAALAVFAPVFEKHDATPAGLDALRAACRHKIPVLALGGVMLANARACLDAGAAGVAGIRLFQQGDFAATVSRLRAL